MANKGKSRSGQVRPGIARVTGSGLKLYQQENVHEMALRRIAWLFDEFPRVFVNVSGGKDSTVLFHLALQVAREKDRLPLNVFWIDQEAEWQATVDLCADWMTHPDVRPYWLQVPFRIFNATSTTEHWLNAWDLAAKDRWLHPHHPVSFKENVYGTDRFHELFEAASSYHLGEGKACALAGVRTEEARTRAMGLTHYATYKSITWGAVRDKKREQFTFHPLYDWSYTDIWKAIHDNGWPYNRIYDLMFQRGENLRTMRVSNLHHETAVHQLWTLQELEPATYERLVARVEGIDMAGKFGAADYFPKTLPFMFSTWREYRDHLLAKLVGDDYRPKLAHIFMLHDRRCPPEYEDWLARAQINSILMNDHEGEKIEHVVRNQAYMQAQREWEARREQAG